jgi:hypothetical protein
VLVSGAKIIELRVAYVVGGVDGGEGALEAHHLLVASVCLERRIAAEQVIVPVLDCRQLVVGRCELVGIVAEERALAGEKVVFATTIANEVNVASRLRLA